MYYITDRKGHYINKSFAIYSKALEYANKIQGEVITDCWCECYSSNLQINFVLFLN